MNTEHTRKFITDFIEEVWNQQRTDKMDNYLHPAYIDHSLPAFLTPDHLGLIKWIQALSTSFSHQTIIEDQVTEAERSIIKIRMVMTHIGEWRGIKPQGAQVSTGGYRFYRLADGRIMEHWAEINGTALENQLTRGRTS